MQTGNGTYEPLELLKRLTEEIYPKDASRAQIMDAVFGQPGPADTGADAGAVVAVIADDEVRRAVAETLRFCVEMLEQAALQVEQRRREVRADDLRCLTAALRARWQAFLKAGPPVGARELATIPATERRAVRKRRRRRGA